MPDTSGRFEWGMREASSMPKNATGVTKKVCPQKGKKYAAGQRKQILADAAATSVAAASEKHGCSPWIIYDWRRKAEQAATAANEFPVAVSGPTPAPVLDASQRDMVILEMWKKHPGLGPSQIRNQLRREKALRAGVSTVRNVMVANGYVLPKTSKKEHTGKYEALRPRHLYHLDFLHFFVHRLKVCLLFLLDDFSRFIVGWNLVSSEQVDVVIKTVDASVNRYGKPEYVMSDGGSAFFSWKGIGRFTRFLEELGIDQWIAQSPEVNGKVEALNGTVQKELINRIEFADRDDAARQLGAWVRHYNFQRTHHALGGLLVPADRFFGCEEESLRRIEEGHGGSPLDLMAPESRTLELFRVVSEAGKPSVYLMGRKLLGS